MTTLPPELVLDCLCQLEASDPSTLPTLLSVSLASRTFHDLSRSTILWRPLFELEYFRRGKAVPVDETPKTVYETFRARALSDQRAKSLVRELQKPLNRLPVMEELRNSLGSDVVQVLDGEEWRSPSKKPETYLSLHYWSEEARKTILRDEAIKTWQGIVERDLRNEEDDADFERGVNAFGAFRGFDPELIERHHYDLSLHPTLLALTSTSPSQPIERLHWIATTVCEYMLSINLTPSTPGSFHDLSNHYVELAFVNAAHPENNHGTLPMTLVSIFCSFVRRLPTCQDLEVRPIGFPGTVLAGLRARGTEEWVYVNPYAAPRARLPTRPALKAMLTAMSLTEQPSFFRPATAREMCTRVSRNILTSIQTRQVTTQTLGIACLYSISHSLLALTPRSGSTNNPQLDMGPPNYIDWLTSIVQAEFPYDAPFLTNSVLPLLRTAPYSGDPHNEDRIAKIEALVEAIEDEDSREKEKKWIAGKIKWEIGHVFRHRLFGYHAVIRGWDYKCKASETWIMQMQVDRLPFGREQPFYHVIVADGSTRYVAQENITPEPVSPGIIARLLTDATIGRYFRKVESIGPAHGYEGEGEEDFEGRMKFIKSWETEEEYPDS